MATIDITVTALGDRFRVEGEFTPGSPAITRGSADNWEPAEPAQWDECTVRMADGQDDLTEVLERLIVPNTGGRSALAEIQDLAELEWLRQRDANRWAA